MIRKVAQTVRRLARGLLGAETFYQAEVRCPRVMLGGQNTGFVINPELLGSSSIIYSFGIGTDISFDLACVERFSAQIHVFDPTPRSLAWINAQSIPSEVHVYPYGLSDVDGTMTLHPPADPEHVSYSLVERGGGEKSECPVYRLRSIMQMLGHTYLDLLKMDVEGCEYDAIASLLADSVPIRQLCIEFHHRWPEIGKIKTDSAITALRSAGYRIFHVSPAGQEFSFIHTGPCLRANTCPVQSPERQRNLLRGAKPVHL